MPGEAAMAIITVARGSFSSGKILAECVADRLGYRCIDRDVIVERAAAYGASPKDLLEALTKPPTFWDRFTHKKYVYLSLIQAALAEEVLPGNAVYHGHAGHLLLRGVSHVIRTRIIVPIEFRVSIIQERLRLGREEGLAYIQKMDQDRQRWTHYLYGVDWADPSLYDMVVNLENMEPCEACEVIAACGGLKCYSETPESRAAMANLALASKVRATLVTDASTSHLEVEVDSRDGSVTVRGKVNDPDERHRVQEVVERVAGVTRLNMDDLVSAKEM
jgi:cytidylate kinase